MKIFFNLNQLSMSWNEKQKPQRFRRYAAMLIMLLTLGVGQMWAGETKYNWTANKVLYYDNSSTQWAQPYLRIGCGSGDGDWSNYYAMEAVPGTQNCWKYTFGNGYSNYAAFHVANNTGGHNYNVYWEGSSNAWTECIDWQKYAVSGHIILSTSESGKKYCSVTKTSGDTKFSVTYSTAGTGSGTLSVTKYNGTSYDAFTSGNSVLPTQIMKIVATPDPGNALTSFSVSGATQIGESNTYYVTANTTISATFTPEETHDVTVSYKCGAMTIANSTTESAVGVTTTRSVTAPAINDHTWASWTVGTGVKNNSANTTTNPISINSKASGSYTLQANYTLVPCSLYIHTSSGTFATQEAKYLMSYDPDVDAYYYEITTTSSPYYFRFYHNNATQYSAAWEGGSYPNIQAAAANGDKITCDQNVNLWGNKSSVKFTGLSGSTIKIWFDYNNKKCWVTETTYSVSIASENTNRGTVNKSSVTAGKNTTSASFTATPVTNSGWMFKQWSATSPASLVSSATTNPNTVKATSTGGSVQAQFKHRYILRGSTNASDSELGGMAGWGATDNSSYASATISDGVMTITANLTKAKTKYKFKIYDLSADSHKGQTGSSDIPDNTPWTLNGSNNVTLTTTAAGTYTFVYTVSSNSLKVLFPSPVYSVTYGVQSGTGTVTAKIGTESIGASPGKAVGGTDVVMRASDGTGYQFSKWVNQSGTQISTSNPYTISSIAANCTIKAVFTARNYTAANNMKEANGTANGQYNVTYDNTSIAHTSAPSRTGYTVEGYYKQAAWTNKIANTNLSLVASTDYATSASKWKVTSAPDLYIKWQQTLTLAGNGAGSTNGSVTTTYLGTASSHTAATRTGYTLNGYYDNTSGGNKILTNTGALVSYSASVSSYINSAGKWIYNGTPTLSAQWTANNYDVTLKANTGTGDDQLVQATYDVAMPLTLKNSSTAITVHTKTGYTLLGYWDDASSGNQYYSYNAGTSTLSSYRTWNKDAATNLFAHWSANTYRVTLDVDEEHKGDIASATTYQDVTYDGSTTTVPNRPTAAQGYALVGYYTDQLGEGTKVINGDGTWIASVAGYTDASKHWVHAGDVTLYAYYKKAEITAITFDNAVVESEGTVSFAVTVSPTPTGTTKLCFTVLHSNDNPLAEQPTITYNGGTGKYSFTAPAASGTYKVEAVLRTGSSCDGGTELDTEVANFQVAGTHTVTVQFKCGDEIIKASETVTGRPLDPTEITAPEIVGYAFSKWKAGDGITIEGADGNGEKASATINFTAIYDGKLTAIYTQKRVIYFYNTLNWENVYVYFYSGSYWNSTNGTGSKTGGSYTGINGQMQPISEGSPIYYFDAEAAGVNASYTYVSFTELHQNNTEFFEKTGTTKNKVVYRDDYKSTTLPMFVPLSDQPAVSKNGGAANYYCEGYWMNYPANSGYTLRIYDTPLANNATGASREFLIPFSEDVKMPLKQEVEVNFSGESWFIIYRNDGKYLEGEHTFKQTDHGDKKITSTAEAGTASKMRLISDGSGIYTFTLTFRGDGGANYDYYLNVDFPAAVGDYRIVYSDGATWSGSAHDASWNHPSDIIGKNTSETDAKEDTVSFFISHGSSPSMKFQRISAISESEGSYGKITWEDVPSGSITIPTSITASGVYNFIVTQPAGGASISLVKAEPYTGNYYIRTDCAGETKWNNFRSPDHLITYSEYSITHGGYSHYYAHWVQTDDKKNIQFCIANDYSSAISDTLIRENNSDPAWANINNYIDEKGNILRNANVRFMWNQSTNKVSRAYVDGAQDEGSRFLVISSTDGMIKKADGSALSNNEVTFSDNENWIYEANVKAQPNALIKLKSTWGESNTIEQYFKGSSSTTEKLIGGSGSLWYDIRILYDFKTNRLIASYIPVDENIESEKAIEADIMFIREHQGDIAQLTFGENGKISQIKTAYGVMRFNKWTLANKSKEAGHAPLGSPASIYERSLFYISFPFRVKLSEVIGFGSYGEHWAIQRYDGAARAQKGHFQENGSFWRWMNRNTEYLEPNQGYLLAIDLDLLGESSDVWGPASRSEQIELYFPSFGTMPDITNADVVQTIPSHECTINWAETQGLPDTKDPRTSYNRTIFDSHWNVMSVPTYVNTDDVSFANTTWTGDHPSFLYTWNADDNTITATSASGYTYHAMHAYMVQYGGTVTWSASSGSPAGIVARRTYAEKPSKVEFRLELQQNEKMIDRTYVALSDDEETSAGFRFGEDMTKEFNNKSSIYTSIPGEALVAGNTLPMSDQTTIVPVGVDINTNGDYTFAIPDGTSGIGVTLIDTENNIRTSLSALNYTVNLTAGTHDGRFLLEIAPIQQTPTGMEEVTGDGLEVTGARKVIIDQKMYIIRDGKMYDARGAMIK